MLQKVHVIGIIIYYLINKNDLCSRTNKITIPRLLTFNPTPANHNSNFTYNLLNTT